MQDRRIDFRDQIARNKRNSFFLMLIIFMFLVVLGYVISYATDPGYFFIIMIIAIIFSLFYIVVGYYNSDKIAIASVKAKQATPTEFPDFHRLVEGLTLASGMPKPRLYVMDSQQINAFASGRDPAHSVICVTKGALDKLDRRELEAVLSHELSHIANYDIRYITTAAVLVGMVAIISEIFLRSLWFSDFDSGKDKNKMIFMIIGIALAILAPIAVYFVQLAISRKREYSADATAVKFTRYPDALIRALEKIEEDYKHGVTSDKKVSKATAPLFFANPFKGMGSTHPPIEKRIAVLKKM